MISVSRIGDGVAHAHGGKWRWVFAEIKKKLGDACGKGQVHVTAWKVWVADGKIDLMKFKNYIIIRNYSLFHPFSFIKDHSRFNQKVNF